MKNTGITRRLDQLNRITLPKELCRNLGYGLNENMEIYVEDDSIIIRSVKANQNKKTTAIETVREFASQGGNELTRGESIELGRLLAKLEM